MKKVFMAGAAISILNTSIFAGNLYKSLLYSPEAENYGIEFHQLKLKMVAVNEETMGFGYYIGLGGGSKSHTNNNNAFGLPSKKVDMKNYLLNIGTTFRLMENLVVFGGVGTSYFDPGNHGDFAVNFNTGAMVTMYDKVGLLAEYDTATKALGFGLGYKF